MFGKNMIVQFDYPRNPPRRLTVILGEIDFMEATETDVQVALRSGTSFILYGTAAVFFKEVYAVYLEWIGSTSLFGADRKLQKVKGVFSQLNPVIISKTKHGAVTQ